MNSWGSGGTGANQRLGYAANHLNATLPVSTIALRLWSRKAAAQRSLLLLHILHLVEPAVHHAHMGFRPSPQRAFIFASTCWRPMSRMLVVGIILFILFKLEMGSRRSSSQPLQQEAAPRPASPEIPSRRLCGLKVWPRGAPRAPIMYFTWPIAFLGDRILVKNSCMLAPLTHVTPAISSGRPQMQSPGMLDKDTRKPTPHLRKPPAHLLKSGERPTLALCNF